MNNSAKILFVQPLHKIESIIQEKNYQILLITTGNCLR